MSEENIGGEDSIIDERRKKLEILRKNNKAVSYTHLTLPTNSRV